MSPHDLLLMLGAKTLLLSLAALVTGAALRFSRCRSPEIHRAAWLIVLAVGILGFGIPVNVPVNVPVDQQPLPPAGTGVADIDIDNDDAVSIDGMIAVAPLPVARGFRPSDLPAEPLSAEAALPTANVDGDLALTAAQTLPQVSEADDRPAQIAAEPETAVAANGDAVERSEASRRFVSAMVFRAMCIVWVTGVIVILLWRLIMQGVLLRRLRSAVVADDPYRGEWEALLAEHRISPGKLPLLLTDGIGPGLIRRPGGMAVVVPRDLWEDTPPELREGMLRHELAHYRNRDMLRLNLARLCASVHWFNPVAWLAVGKLDEAAEWLSDLAAFGSGENGTLRFAQSLVAVHETRQSLIVNRLSFGGGSLKRRLGQLQTFMTQQKESKMKKRTISTLLAVLAMAMIFRVQFVPVAAESVVSPEPPVVTATLDESIADEPAVDTMTSDAVTVTLTGQNGEAVAGGYVRAYPNPKPDDWDGLPKNIRLEDGRCIVPLSNFERLQSLKLVFYADGFAPYETSWLSPETEPIPAEYEHALEPAAERIGGIVVDTAGNPVEGATVSFAVDLLGRQRHPGFITTRYMQWLTTDAEGRWSYATLPPEQITQIFDMTIEHPNLPRLRIHQDQTFRDYVQKDEQGRFSKTVTMPDGLPLKGRVVDPQGNPVEGAVVYTDAIRQGSVMYKKTSTDAAGEFVFENCPPGGDLNWISLGVWHADFAPAIISLGRLDSEMPPQELQLQQGRKVVFRTVDTDGNPLEDVRIVVRNWKRGTGNYFIFFNSDDPWLDYAKTDGDGLFVWSNAPHDDFQLEIGDKNRQNMWLEADELKFGDEENRLVFKPLIEVTGKVTDAETGEPIPNFEVTEWIGFKNGGALIREFNLQKGTNGEFAKTVGHRMGELDRYHLRVDAEGYEGVLSATISPNVEKATLNFALVKGDSLNTLSGVVLLPNGEPAGNVTIGVSIPDRSIQTQQGHLFYQGGNNNDMTDAEGKFRISRSRVGIHGDEDYKLLFLHDTGTICMNREEFERHPGPIRLEAWGRIEGTIYIGDQPASNHLFMYSNDYKQRFDPGTAHIDHFHTGSCDENGRYVIERVFPGRGNVSRAIRYNDNSTTAPFRSRNFEIKPGETLTLDLAGGGSSARGQVFLYPFNMPVKMKDVDWSFMHVVAKRSVPDLAMPEEYSRAYYRFFGEPLGDPRLNDGWVRNPYEIEEILNAWLESPAGTSAVAETPELYAKAKEAMTLILEHGKKQHDANQDRIIATVEAPDDPEVVNGFFTLDGITPDHWTLEVEMNWPRGPRQYWDFLETWKTKTEFTVPNLPAEESFEIPPIQLGSEHAVGKR